MPNQSNLYLYVAAVDKTVMVKPGSTWRDEQLGVAVTNPTHRTGKIELVVKGEQRELAFGLHISGRDHLIIECF